MKELEKHSSEKTEQHAIKPIKKELNFMGSVRLQRGQKLWQMNLETREISLAEYEVIHHLNKEGGSTKERKLIVKENHLYAPAINAKNADKQFFKLLGLKYHKSFKPKAK